MTAPNGPPSPAAGAACPRLSLRRLAPLVVVIVVSVGVIAFGWHRQISFEQVARHHEALSAFIAMHELQAVAAYIAVYIVAAALSIPAGFYLTVIGGILFGAILGGAAALVGATTGAICIFLIARSAVGEYFVRRAGPLAEKLAQGFRADAFSYLLFLRLVPIFPFWVVNLMAALAGATATLIFEAVRRLARGWRLLPRRLCSALSRRRSSLPSSVPVSTASSPRSKPPTAPVSPPDVPTAGCNSICMPRSRRSSSPRSGPWVCSRWCPWW